jgi:hypothetical protein
MGRAAAGGARLGAASARWLLLNVYPWVSAYDVEYNMPVLNTVARTRPALIANFCIFVMEISPPS